VLNLQLQMTYQVEHAADVIVRIGDDRGLGLGTPHNCLLYKSYREVTHGNADLARLCFSNTEDVDLGRASRRTGAARCLCSTGRRDARTVETSRYRHMCDVEHVTVRRYQRPRSAPLRLSVR